MRTLTQILAKIQIIIGVNGSIYLQCTFWVYTVYKYSSMRKWRSIYLLKWKKQTNHWMDCCEIFCRCSQFTDESLWLWWSSRFSSSACPSPLVWQLWLWLEFLDKLSLSQTVTSQWHDDKIPSFPRTFKSCSPSCFALTIMPLGWTEMQRLGLTQDSEQMVEADACVLNELNIFLSITW